MKRKILYLLFFMSISIPARSGNYCRDVFEKLVNAAGNPYGTRPVLTIVQSDKLVAETYGSGEIKIGSRLVDLCRKFGKDSCNAIAHILSHELAHYYQNHAWISNFTSAYASSEWSRHLNENERQLLPVYETQADEIGFFYAFNAGYQPWKISAPLLDSIYTWYTLPAELEGYPPLTERKNIADLSKQKIEALLPLYKIANYFTLLGKYYPGETQYIYYESAGYCLDHLLHENISTPGIMNNLGVIYLLQAQAYMYAPLQKLLLPVMLDDQPLSINMDEAAGSRGGFHIGASQELSDTALLWVERASDLFLKSAKLDKNYLPAYINMALVHFVKREEGSMGDKLKTIHRLADAAGLYPSAVYQLDAFLYYLSADQKKMNDAFKKAIRADDNIDVLVNKELLNGMNSDTREHNLSTRWAVDTLEKIFTKRVNDFYKSYRSRQETRIDPYHQKFILWTEKKEEGIIYTFRSLFSQTIYRDMFFFEITSPVHTTSRGIRLGSAYEEMNQVYGHPYASTRMNASAYHLYPSQSMIVHTDDETGLVTGIMYYGTKK